MLPENPLPVEPSVLKTRWNCAVRGAWIFGLAFMGVLLVQFVIRSGFSARTAGSGVTIGQGSPLHYLGLTAFLTTFYIGAPPIAAIGAYIAYDLYRLASGARQANETKWYVWVLAFFCIGYWLLILYLQYRRRNQLIVQRNPPSWVGPVLYGILILLWSFAFLTGGSQDPLGGILLTIPLTLCLADCLIVNQIAAWQQAELLDAPESYKFQFSLGTLFFCVLGFGAYASGLVLILR